MLTKEELITLQNLLFTGKWNLSMQESRQIVEPLINKLADMAKEPVEKVEEKK